MQRQIILASISPRRKQLMELLKIKFKVVDSRYREVMSPHMRHGDLVKFLALGKAQAAAKKYMDSRLRGNGKGAIIIAADSMVSFRGKIIGKPKTVTQARLMLKNFSGKAHYLITGAVVMDASTKQVLTAISKTKIFFKKLSEQDISDYVNSGEPFDKAGGYNLQAGGFNLLAKIEGDFTNALGLPMGFVFNALEKLGVNVYDSLL